MAPIQTDLKEDPDKSAWRGTKDEVPEQWGPMHVLAVSMSASQHVCHWSFTLLFL